MDEVNETQEGLNMSNLDEIPENHGIDPAQPNLQDIGSEEQKGHYEFSDLNEGHNAQSVSNIDFLLDIPLEISIELGRTKMLINELLKLGQGAVIELSKFAGETLDVFANQRLIAKGEVVVINDKYGIRLTEIISPMERIVKLK